MIWIAIVIGLLVVAGVITAWSWRSHDDAPKSITPPARRILFPFLGDTIAPSTLDATLRLARAEGATLVPAYVVVVPLSLSLGAPAPGECSQAMLLLETIEQRAARLHVAIDSRIETGRSARHALRQLIDQERFDRIILPAASPTSEGFTSDDVAWLLEHATGEIVVVRPGGARASKHRPAQNGRYASAA